MNRVKKITQILCSVIIILALVGCSSKLVISDVITPTPTKTVQDELLISKYPRNYTSFKIQTAQGVTLVTDPFFMNEDVQADIVTISHYHMDHSNLARVTGAYKLLDKEGVFNEKGITITGVGGHHNKGDLSTTNIIYTFDFDGIRLAEFASLGELPTEAMFAQIGKIDILIVQIIGIGYGKLSVEEVGNIVQRLQAKIVIPAHGDPEQTDDLSAALGVQTEIITDGKLAVTKVELDKQQKPRIVVLDVQE